MRDLEHGPHRNRLVWPEHRCIGLDAHDDVLVAVVAAVADGDRDAAAALQQAGELHLLLLHLQDAVENVLRRRLVISGMSFWMI